MIKSQRQLHGGHDDSLHVLSHITITPEVISRLETFFEFMPPHALRERLMAMYHSYILHEHDYLPDDFTHVAEGMIMFFNFLKFAGEEFNAQYSGDRPRPSA
jgi:hypothetical protein